MLQNIYLTFINQNGHCNKTLKLVVVFCHSSSQCLLTNILHLKDDATIPLIATYDGTSYWVSKFSVFATHAEKACQSRGGTLARVRDANQQKILDNVIWKVTIDGGRKFCIAGKYKKSTEFPSAGYYWMNSSECHFSFQH